MREFKEIARRALVAVVVTTAISSTVEAAPVVFAGLDNANLSGGGAHPNSDGAQAAFAAAAAAEGGLAVQNFDGLPVGPAPAGFAVGSINATLSATATDHTTIATGVSALTTYAVSGTQFLDSLTARDSTYFSVSFDQAVSGFGFHITDASDWAGDPRPTTNLVVTLKYQNTQVELNLFDGISAANMVNGSLGFWGVVDSATPLLGFAITNPAGNPDADAIGLDNLSVALVKIPTTVPLPGSLLLILSALGGMVGVTRRRRSPAL